MMKKELEDLSNKLHKIENLITTKHNKPLTLVQAAEYLSISQSHLYRLTSQRKIPFYKPSGKYLYFYQHELDTWITSSERAKSKSEMGEVEKKNVEMQNIEDEEEEEPP